jgi:tetratricopeptide (TPR) repeat protein
MPLKTMNCGKLVEHVNACYGHISNLKLDEMYYYDDEMERIAFMLERVGEWKKAEEMQRRLLEGRAKLGGDTTLNAKHNLAKICSELGKHNEAERLLLEIFQFMTDTANVNHDYLLLDVANSLARVCSSQLKWDESENLLHSSLETYGQTLGKMHAHTLRAMEHLAWTYMRKYRLKEAEIMELEVIEGYKKIIGLSHPNSIGAMRGLAWIYEQQQKYSEAEELCLQALRIHEEKLGANDPQTLTSMAV